MGMGPIMEVGTITQYGSGLNLTGQELPHQLLWEDNPLKANG